MTKRSFRLVCPQGQKHLVEELLRFQGFGFESEPFLGSARFLTEEPFPLGTSLAARFGLIYIQDRSSMLPPVMLAPDSGEVVLDMCSAPGSKTGLLSRMVGPDGFVMGMEPSPNRIGVLRANLRRTGAINTATSRADSRRLPFPDRCFTHILLDPPCSGWGTEDRNPGVRERWSGEKTVPLIRLQRELLTEAARMLAPNGRLLYSTCTTNVEEDEDQVLWAMTELGLKLMPLDQPPGFEFDAPKNDAVGTLRVSEDSDGQGFFMALLTRPGHGDPEDFQPVVPPGKDIDLTGLQSPAALDAKGLPQGTIRDFRGRAVFMHHRASEIMPGKLSWQGYTLGRIAGGKFRPDALCRTLMPLSPGNGCVSLDDPAQIQALTTGQSLNVDKETGKGQIALYYKELALGWCSIKGSRLLWQEK